MIQAEAFDALASSANGIAKLRELILELAVRGLLVPQDPNDETASILLEKINAEKQRLVNKGEIKKQKALPEIMEEDKPFNLPIGWEWVPIRQVTSDRGQKVPDQNFTYIDVGSINKELGFIANAKILRADQAPSRARKIAQTGDVLYSCVRPYLLNIAIIENDIEPKPIVSTAFAVLNGFGMVIPKFLWITLRSKYMIDCVELRMRGLAYPAINDADFATLPFPLPPLAEQHRIIAKVEELMTLCDQLEQHQDHSNTVHQHLLQTLLESLTQAADNEALQKIWSQIAAHFDTLFTTEASIDQLKQVILQLAVMGKLVPQDSNDEPASVLLEKIAEEKAQLVKKPKVLPKISEDEKPFELPQDWEWVRFGEVANTRLGKMLDKSKNRGKPKPYLRNTNVQWHRFELDDVKEMRFEDEELDEFRILRGDLLICEGGEPGRCAIWQDSKIDIYFQKAIHRARAYTGVIPEYLQICLTSDAGNGSLTRYFTGATIKHFPGDKLNRYVFPLPPTEEQYRIITRVDELMAICDLLKSRINKSQQTQEHLATAIVEKTAA